jgi:hypothetical protein
MMRVQFGAVSSPARKGQSEPVKSTCNQVPDQLLAARAQRGGRLLGAGEISDGDLKIGHPLPTENSLIARFLVSRPDHRPSDHSASEIRRGEGAFVAAPKIRAQGISPVARMLISTD